MLVAANLGAGVLPEWHPGWPRATRWIVAFSAAFLFFASVLAHELSHSVVGRAMGIKIERITLFFLGGVAHLDEQPKTAKSEFLMAIAGPLMSMAIGIGATIAGLAMVPVSGSIDAIDDLMSHAGPLPTLLLWLGPINIVLAVFNMLPGFPLDGGRVLRAVLWWLTGDHDKATTWAGRAGKARPWPSASSASRCSACSAARWCRGSGSESWASSSSTPRGPRLRSAWTR